MPLIHFIDLYLTFKFCPLTKTAGFLQAENVWDGHLHTWPPQREMVAFINAPLCNTDNHSNCETHGEKKIRSFDAQYICLDKTLIIL